MENRKVNSRNNSKTGRLRKEKKLTASINLKLTEADFSSVKEKAQKLGMKATQYVRDLKGEYKIPLYTGGARPNT